MTAVSCVLDARARLGECPRWDVEDQRLYWVDIPAWRLHAFDPVTGENRTFQHDEEIGCIARRASGGFIAALRSGFAFIDGLDGGIRPIADPEADKPDNRFNDGRCDPAGRFWAGTMNERKSAADASLYRLGTDLVPVAVCGGALTSNGLAFSPDGRTMYYADTPRHVVYAFDFDVERATATHRRVFHQFPEGQGRPDGAAVDAQGHYWSALYDGGRVVRLNPAGEIVAEIPVPARHCTMVAFGGPALKTLFITTARDNTGPEDLARWPQAGGIFAVDVAVPGLPEPRFAG